jgi:hypothetical protein
MFQIQKHFFKSFYLISTNLLPKRHLDLLFIIQLIGVKKLTFKQLNLVVRKLEFERLDI